MSATRVCGVLLAVTLAAAGCSSGSDDTDPQPEATPMGKDYVSTKVEGLPIPGGGPLNLGFEDSRVHASAGCNSASGPVSLTGNVLETDQLAMTLMGCPDETAGADGWMTGLLESKPTWKLDGPNLTISGNGSTVTLLDRKVAHPDKPLTGTTWIVTALVSADAVTRSVTLDEVRPTLTIAQDGAVSGSAGFNQMIGTAEIAGTDVTFKIGTTKMLCAPEVMEVEQQVLAALDGKTTVTIDSDKLSIRNPANNTGLDLNAE
ncbi:META domain-containing protein [Nocardia crassostreae]|uniref:META domain-containing protein n=1 Tax=Nocardia crassostreae TaxID=53428 RepID=UPI000830A0E7|nr:META domain-containing protein [Nocardia crassostreae]